MFSRGIEIEGCNHQGASKAQALKKKFVRDKNFKKYLEGQEQYICGYSFRESVLLSKAVFEVLMHSGILQCLRVMPKALQLPFQFFFSFFSFSFLSLFVERHSKVFRSVFYSSLTRKHVTKVGFISFDTLKIVSVKLFPLVVICDTCGT